MEVDVHKIITTLFNVEMNGFIAKFSKGKTIETVKTGGLWEIRVTEEDVFNRYANWLKTFRGELFSKSVNWSLPLDSFREELGPLLQFYANIENLIRLDFFQKHDQVVLTNYLVKRLFRFFNSLDRHFRTTYFRRNLKSLKSQHELVMKVVNSFNLPISHVEAEVSYVLAPIFGEYSKTIPICSLKTDESGTTKIKLLKGHYRIDVGKYGKTRFENLYENKEITFKVLDIAHLLKNPYVIASIVTAICVIIMLVLILTESFPFDLI